MRLVYREDNLMVPWICHQLNIRNPHPCVAIGIERDDRIIAGALYGGMQLDTYGKPFLIEISFASIDTRWATRHNICALLGYPFFQLKVKRVQSTVSKRNKTVRLFLERLGFKLEGVGRQAWVHGGDACMYSMLSGEFFSSKWHKSGQKFTFGSDTSRS